MDTVLLWKATLLGIVEGVTEFLPISSTGHLILAGHAIDFNDPTFEIFIQFGAICAVIVMYWADLWQRLSGLWRPGPDRRVVVNLLVAFAPAAVMGLLFHRAIKTYLFAPLTVALALVIGGVAIIFLERRPANGRTTSLEAMTVRQGLAVGCGQVIAMWPGFSRAAASILGGMLGGLDRHTATVFSFYLAIPTMLGATVVALKGSWTELSFAQLPSYAVGFLVSFLVAWIAIKGLLRYIAHHTFSAFGVYRIVVGVVVLWVLW